METKFVEIFVRAKQKLVNLVRTVPNLVLSESEFVPSSYCSEPSDSNEETSRGERGPHDEYPAFSFKEKISMRLCFQKL